MPHLLSSLVAAQLDCELCNDGLEAPSVNHTSSKTLNMCQCLVAAQLDWSSALVGGGFQFKNPNASASCGCGKSFGV